MKQDVILKIWSNSIYGFTNTGKSHTGALKNVKKEKESLDFKIHELKHEFHLRCAILSIGLV